MVLPHRHPGDFKPIMIIRGSRSFKAVCFTIGGISSFFVCIYSYYIYFLMRDRFGFSGKDNLAFAALNGLIYTIAAWQGGRFGQRRGYFNAFKVGFGALILAMAAGSQCNSALGLVLATGLFNVGMCFIWPTIEALVSEGEDAIGLPRMVGTYNVVWAATNALALFGGGTLVEKFGFKTIFYLPGAAFIALLGLVFWLQKHADAARDAGHEPVFTPVPDPHRPSPAKTRAFLRMAWLANPVAYIAINTFIPMLPTLAAQFQLTPMFAGFACSLWGFARLGTFIALWVWTDWHYRFRWLMTAFVLLIGSFATILIVPSLVAVLAAQIFFGLAIGMIYYSSLFYSMDASEAKGEHGGIHEAAIGVGNCIGPAVGAASLQWVPQYASSGGIAVSGLLLLGLGALVTIWKTAR
jgi:predicted MFS family arabinose efflux permease